MQYKITREEYVNASWRLVRNRVFIVLGIMLVAVCFIGLPQADFSGDPLMDMLPYIIMIVIAIPLSILLRRRKFGRGYDQQKSFQSPVTLDLKNERMHFISDRGEYLLPWTDITKWFESDKFYFVFESSLFAKILPKRAFSDEEDRFFRAQLSKNKSANKSLHPTANRFRLHGAAEI